MKIDNKAIENVIKNFPDGNTPFSHQDLEQENKKDAQDWINSDELVAIVSEEHGGIIGYVHKSHADEVVVALNLQSIQSQK